ncbi:hypothetical protein SPRG_20680 [Saprolegnia parasitica CBS 223.65]|uniref:F-box domain-containing protein n=1 Tax=Saprolegnia parasitica (strain CBS 223.65) TaxID=695850 RepID=A0A067C8R5_SAPPC|nr:hypothetical protein SPRG_20680 [Saprolegnia parasitica CBS 223.65]KDO25560.1 hypothetical protein SPRG_20680 [Saprolegnia parasitica CBS 223.65]|eukprot:XP_012203780.1 hypothetical protein SPRG_20680 [Saprolegnia parasitica CBS 223.65]
MGCDKRQRRAASGGLIPAMTLEIAHYLDDPEDVVRFLRALPSHVRGEELSALFELLVRGDHHSALWPVLHLDDLDGVCMATLTRALPAFHTIYLFEGAKWALCRNTMLPPTTHVYAWLDDAYRVSDNVCNWARNVVALSIETPEFLKDPTLLGRALSACTNLRALTLQWQNVDQMLLDQTLAVVVSTRPELASLHLKAENTPLLEDATSLVRWLRLPNATTFKLTRLDLVGPAAATLATALLASPTLTKIKLEHAPCLARLLLDPALPPLPRQLHKLTLRYRGLSASVPAIAAKVASSRLTNLALSAFVPCNFMVIVAALPHVHAMAKVKLTGADLVAFPILPQLRRLALHKCVLSKAAVIDLATLLTSSTRLEALDLSESLLPDAHARHLLLAVPRWCSQRGPFRLLRLCHTALSDESAAVLAIALATARNTSAVWIDVSGNVLSAASCRGLLTALSATTQMTLMLYNAGPSIEDLVTHAQTHGVGSVRALTFTSPPPEANPWTTLNL